MEILTTKEAAEYLKVSTSTLYRMRRNQTSPAYYRQGKGNIFYQKRDLDNFIKKYAIY